MKSLSRLYLFTIIPFTAILLLLIVYSSNLQENKAQSKSPKGNNMAEKKSKTDKEWRELLTPEQYSILREKGTERPFTGKYWNFDKDGVYRCAACGEILFDSKTKFDAGCGWPSFSDVVNGKNVILKDDFSHGMNRTEVVCAKCGSHLGHVFNDGPHPTGQRYCINSVSIEFSKREEK